MHRDQDIGHSIQTALIQIPQGDYPSAPFNAPTDYTALRAFLRIVWNRRWVVLSFALLVGVVAAIRTVKQKPVYVGLGTIEVEMPRESNAGIQDFFPSLYVLPSYIQTQAKIMSSGPLARKVMDQLNLWRNPEPATPDSRLSEERAFQEGLKVKLIEGSHLLQVSYTSEDPARAASVVNAVMSLYVKQNEDDRLDAAKDASGWLGDQLKIVKARLDESMDTLRRYEREHELLTSNPDRERLMNIDADRLQHLQQELAQLESTRTEKEALYKRVRAGDTQLLQSSLLEENLKKEAELDLQLARLTQKFGPNFPQVQRGQEELVEVRRTMAAERERLFKRVEEEYQAASDQEGRIRVETEELRKKIAGGSDQMMEYSVLKRDVELNQQAYEGLLQKLQEATTRASLKTPTARIVDPAELPAVSSHPELVRNFCFGMLAGMLVGMGLALGENHLRDTINTTAEVESDLNLQLLGVVPTVQPLSIAPTPAAKKGYFGLGRLGSDPNGKPKPGNWFRLDRDASDRYVLSEAISNLRASLMFALEDTKPRAVLFSSSLPSEGKTTISSNLSISLTQIGKKVLMIDGDLRRPCLHKVFSVPNRAGLSEYLRGVCEWTEVLQPSSVPGLDLVVCGERPENPAELLSSGRMRQIIEQAKLRYDYVVVDSPTLLNMADSRILASYVDNVVLIVRSRATPKLLAKRACANVQGAGATIVGAVLNQQEVRDSEYSYSYYGYGQPKEVRSVNSKGDFVSH